MKVVTVSLLSYCFINFSNSTQTKQKGLERALWLEQLGPCFFFFLWMILLQTLVASVFFLPQAEKTSGFLPGSLGGQNSTGKKRNKKKLLGKVPYEKHIGQGAWTLTKIQGKLEAKVGGEDVQEEVGRTFDG